MFLYPALVWGFIQVLTYARAVQERAVSRVRVIGEDAAVELREFLARTDKIQLVDDELVGELVSEDTSTGGLGTATPASPSGPRITDDLVAAARAELASDVIDVWVRVEKNAATESPEGWHISICFNSSLDGSVKARERLGDAVDEFRRERLIVEARGLGQDKSFVEPLTVEETDLASREEFSKYMASLILPLLMLIMTALGALYPALDVTVGEKERGCLETTMLAPVGRAAIVVGKYLAVVTFALIAFLLNFASMAFTLFHQGSVLQLQPFELGWSSGLIIVAAALLLSSFFSAIMMFLAFQARTFKEGQSYVMPVYLLAVLPTLIVASPEVRLDLSTAFVPLVNIALLFRGALQGNLETGIALASLGSAVLYAVIVLACAVRYLQRREVVADRSGLRLRFWARRKVREPSDISLDKSL